MERILAGRGWGWGELLRGVLLRSVDRCFVGRVVCFCLLMGTSGFPLFGVLLAGLRPGGRPTFLLRQESRQRRRPRFTGRRLRRRLPCAARIGRPAQNSPAARAQTAAPEGPARRCAARRLRRGFSESPSVARRVCVIGEKAGSGGLEKVGSALVRQSPQPFQ